jgi:hypothetical protein
VNGKKMANMPLSPFELQDQDNLTAMKRKIILGSLAVLFFATVLPASAKADAATLIVPGKSIGELVLGPVKSQGYYRGKEPDETTDAAMGGKWGVWWYLGAQPGDKGRPFHRPDGIGALHRGVPESAFWEVFVTSARFRTADGVGPGSTLAAILQKYSGAKSGESLDQYGDAVDASQYWPYHGEVEFYDDKADGIGFAIRKRNGVCVEVAVIDPANDQGEFFRWSRPASVEDYEVTAENGFTGYPQIGELVIGMSQPKIIALLGQPEETRQGNREASWLWWRVPGQPEGEPPGLGIFIRKLPSGDRVVLGMEVTSSQFALEDDGEVHPGCLLKQIHDAAAQNPTRLGFEQGGSLQIYGDMSGGLLLYQIRSSDLTCATISVQFLTSFGRESNPLPTK